jgi:XTP/dITP diphosphohydrolase
MLQKIEKNLVLASENPNKLKELYAIFGHTHIEIYSQSDFNVKEADETGLTFIENAIIKARNASECAKLPALADDSGLEVDALAGAPGVYSSRFSGPNSTSAENISKLLQELKDVAVEKRTARFHCVLAYLRHALDPVPIICHGIWEGVILFKSQGSSGFGYDPIFFVPTHNCSAAELAPEIKNSISHRAKALRQFLQLIEEQKE